MCGGCTVEVAASLSSYASGRTGWFALRPLPALAVSRTGTTVGAKSCTPVLPYNSCVTFCYGQFGAHYLHSVRKRPGGTLRRGQLTPATTRSAAGLEVPAPITTIPLLAIILTKTLLRGPRRYNTFATELQCRIGPHSATQTPGSLYRLPYPSYYQTVSSVSRSKTSQRCPGYVIS